MFSLYIKTDNDAFHPDERQELARILREAADKVETAVSRAAYILRDYNGNKVGEFSIDTNQ